MSELIDDDGGVLLVPQRPKLKSKKIVVNINKRCTHILKKILPVFECKECGCHTKFIRSNKLCDECQRYDYNDCI